MIVEINPRLVAKKYLRDDNIEVLVCDEFDDKVILKSLAGKYTITKKRLFDEYKEIIPSN